MKFQKFKKQCLALAVAGLFPSLAFAQENVSTWLDWLSGLFVSTLSSIITIVQVGGVIAILAGGISLWLLSTDRANQRLKEVGKGGVLMGMGLGGAALVIGTFVRIIVGSTAEGGTIQNSEIDNILGLNTLPSYHQYYTVVSSPKYV
jgi:hypothetical protein